MPSNRRNTVQITPQQIIQVKALICAYAIKHHVKPEDAMAVAHIESRIGKNEFRIGKMGRKYLGPMGIFKGCKPEGLDIRTLDGNIEAGVKALARYKTLKRALKKYNLKFNSGYWKQVQMAQRKYRDELKHGFND